jgi:hypothetical protein
MYAFVHDVPANATMYRQIREKIGDETPKGLISHVAFTREGGLRYVDVWETKQDWERFQAERAEPAVDAVLAGYGIAHDHSLVTFDEVDVIDAWLGRH